MHRWQLIGITCAAALLATACTGSTGTTSAVGASGSANPASCKGVTLRFIGLAGEDGKAVTKAFQAKYHMKISETNVADWPTAISAIKVGQPYDLMTVPMWYAQRMIAARVVRPLDTSKLTEWSNLFPGLAKNSLILGKSGTVYGAPIAWGDGPFVYNPKLVSIPHLAAGTAQAAVEEQVRPVQLGRGDGHAGAGGRIEERPVADQGAVRRGDQAGDDPGQERAGIHHQLPGRNGPAGLGRRRDRRHRLGGHGQLRQGEGHSAQVRLLQGRSGRMVRQPRDPGDGDSRGLCAGLHQLHPAVKERGGARDLTGLRNLESRGRDVSWQERQDLQLLSDRAHRDPTAGPGSVPGPRAADPCPAE